MFRLAASFHDLPPRNVNVGHEPMPSPVCSAGASINPLMSERDRGSDLSRLPCQKESPSAPCPGVLSERHCTAAVQLPIPAFNMAASCSGDPGSHFPSNEPPRIRQPCLVQHGMLWCGTPSCCVRPLKCLSCMVLRLS